MAVLDQAECLVELGDHGVILQLTGCEEPLGLLQLAADPVLLALEEIEGDGIRVVRLEDLLALGGELFDAPLQSCPVRVGVASFAIELIEDEGLDLASLFGRQLHGCVVIDDGLLDLFDQHHTLFAVRAFLLATQAVEVRVHRSPAVLAVHDRQPTTALTTKHRALEVVVMDPLLLAGTSVGFQDCLDAFVDIA